MKQIPIWSERKFEFSFPAELYPNLCARLRGTPARLEEIVRGRPRGILVRKPQDALHTVTLAYFAKKTPFAVEAHAYLVKALPDS